MLAAFRVKNLTDYIYYWNLKQFVNLVASFYLVIKITYLV